MKFISVALMALLTLSITACQTTDPNSPFTKENIGAVTGAIGGAIVGSNIGKGKGNIAGIAAGTLLGGYLGKQIGASLDRADLAYHNQTAQYSLENTKLNTTSSWRNPDTGHEGTITPTRTYQAEAGDYCREYTQTITVGGQTEQAVGEACRQPDGTWKIVR